MPAQRCILLYRSGSKAAGQSWADPGVQSRGGASAKKTLKSSVSVMVYNKNPNLERVMRRLGTAAAAGKRSVTARRKEPKARLPVSSPAAELRAKGHEAGYLPLDVTLADNWDRVVVEVLRWKSRIDILINNAGNPCP